MKKIAVFSLLVSLFTTVIVRAQYLSPTVVSTSGSFYSNSSGMLSSTIGEMTMVNTFSTGSSVLTQGFQQPVDFNVGISKPTQVFSFNIFPNPTSGNLNIQFDKVLTGIVDLNLYDAIGRKILVKRINLDTQSNFINLSMQNFHDGVYVLEIISKNESHYNKIQLIRL